MGLTATLADYAVGTSFDSLPDEVRTEGARALLNWFGVAISGSADDGPRLAAAQIADIGAAPRSDVIGYGFRTDPADAAFVNCISSACQAYDDAHLPSVAHPSGPAAASLFAIAQARKVSGTEFLNAMALSIELQCRLANMLTEPPSTFHPAFYTNGFSGPIGVAAAVGRLIGLDRKQMIWALGLAASQASGFRATHGTMTAHFRAGHATRAGVIAALLAEKGFDCTDNALEAKGGLLDIYAPGADQTIATRGLGSDHVMLTNRYKPYPCGIVIHAHIDACLELRDRIPAGQLPARVEMRVNPAVLTLTGKRAPKTTLESHVSVYHWIACAFLRGTAGLEETLPEVFTNPGILAFGDRVGLTGDAGVGKGESFAAAVLADGTRLESHVTSARGSLERPLNDAELDAKFAALAGTRLDADRIAALLRASRDIAGSADVGATLGPLLP